MTIQSIDQQEKELFLLQVLKWEPIYKCFSQVWRTPRGSSKHWYSTLIVQRFWIITDKIHFHLVYVYMCMKKVQMFLKQELLVGWNSDFAEVSWLVYLTHCSSLLPQCRTTMHKLLNQNSCKTPQCCDYRCVRACLASLHRFWWASKSSCLYGKHLTKWAISPVAPENRQIGL